MLQGALGDLSHEQYKRMAQSDQLDVGLSVVEQNRWFLQEHDNIETILHCAKCQPLNAIHLL